MKTMAEFSPSRLAVARKRRRMTKVVLAATLGLSTRTISAYESGDRSPSPGTANNLAQVLGFPKAFFYGEAIDEISCESASFRALSKMSAGQRDAVLASGTLAIELNQWIERSFELPIAEIPELRDHDPEIASDCVRAEWGLGDRPISNMVHILESRGVRVFSLAEDNNDVDAYSTWNSKTPYVFLNTAKSAERSRFDAAHELAHLILHRHDEATGQHAEREANAFASAFLMPRTSVYAAAPRYPHVNTIIELKKIWNVSATAITLRLHRLSLISEWHYRTLLIQLGDMGYRMSEPDGIPRETSQLLTKVFRSLRRDGLTKDDIANQLLINRSELETIIFGLVLHGVPGGRQQDRDEKDAERPDLKLIYSERHKGNRHSTDDGASSIET